MNTYKSVVCWDLELGNDLDSEHLYNMEIISKNLNDFNARFTTDIVLNYDVVGCVFTPLQEHDEKIIWFCEGINELLAFAHSPTCNEKEELELYLERRRKEIKYLINHTLYEAYYQRYFQYAPLGFLTDENMFYVREKLTKLLFRIE